MLSVSKADFLKGMIPFCFQEYVQKLCGVKDHSWKSIHEEARQEALSFEQSENAAALRAACVGCQNPGFGSMGSSSLQNQDSNIPRGIYFGTSSFYQQDSEKFIYSMGSLMSLINECDKDGYCFTTSVGYWVKPKATEDNPFGVFEVTLDNYAQLLVDSPTKNKKNPSGNPDDDRIIHRNWDLFWRMILATYKEKGIKFFLKSRKVKGEFKIQNNWTKQLYPKKKFVCDWGGGQMTFSYRDSEGNLVQQDKFALSANSLTTPEAVSKILKEDYSGIVQFMTELNTFLDSKLKEGIDYRNDCEFQQTGVLRQWKEMHLVYAR